MYRIFYKKEWIRFLGFLIVCNSFYSCAYFNTFYNAESSYKKALKIIEQTPILDEIEVPEQAKKLLSEAIKNSKEVIKKYPDSNYIDDALFIIGRASFLRDEMAIAESYFKQLLRDYYDSEFHLRAKIWLLYTHLRMGKIDNILSEISEIINMNIVKKDDIYLLNNINAEFYIEKNILDSTYYYYEKAVDITLSTSKKISTYGKLILIAENNQDKIKASKYLVELADIAPDKMRIDVRMKWLTYQRELGNYEKIIVEIQRMLTLSEFSKEYMQLELELGKVYKAMKEFNLAKDVFEMMVEKYSKKNESAEAYYHLGYMAIMEDFNIDLATDYFQKSKEDRPSSYYGRESKDFLNKINKYEILLDTYKDISNSSDKENVLLDSTSVSIDNNTDKSISYSSAIKNQSTNNVSADSVLFIIGEMLLYDFNYLELSLEKFKMVSEKYPKSKFAPQSLYVLSYYEPDLDWRSKLENNYPQSLFLNNNIDTSRTQVMTNNRDYAWSLLARSYEDAYKEFNRLYNTYDDTLSAYIRGFISDNYLHDIENAILHYQEFATKFPEHSYFSIVDNRLKIIQKDLETEKSISQQAIEYKNATQVLIHERDFDSTRTLLKNIIKGEKSHYRNAAKNMKNLIRNYNELIGEINNYKNFTIEDSSKIETMTKDNQMQIGIDSILFNIGNLFAYEFDFTDSAAHYYKEIVESYKGSDFRPYSLLYLSEIDQSNDWMEIFYEEYSDSMYTLDTNVHNSIYLPNIFQEHFIVSQIEKIELCDKYLQYFDIPEIDEEIIANTTKPDEKDKANKLDNFIKEEENVNPYENFEDYIDANNNGKYDYAEEYTDTNNNGNWDRNEPFVDIGNNIYDIGETFIDINGNNIWDNSLWYLDKNNNNRWDSGDPYDDLNNDGRKSYLDPYEDINNNNRYDAPEPIGETKFNYKAISFSESFIDIGNKIYDTNEQFTDLNGDGVWTDAEYFVDSNGDGVWTDAEDFIDSNGNDIWDLKLLDKKQIVHDNKKVDQIYKLQIPVDNAGISGIIVPADSIYENKFEDYVDANNNGKYDHAEKYTDTNNNGKWDQQEPFIDLGNGIYDIGEKFIDINGNNIWNRILWYLDKNNNNIWDAGDPYEDLDNDGRKSYLDPYEDVNSNNKYDPPEPTGSTKFHYLSIQFSEPFVDRANGVYDVGEEFEDLNGDGVWTKEEEFEDLNGDGVWTKEENFEDINGNKIWDLIKTYPTRNDSISQTKIDNKENIVK